MISLSVIGTGTLVKEILPFLSKMPELQLEVLVSSKRSLKTASDLQKTYGFPRIYDDYESMLEQEKGRVDVVYLATPNDTHYAMAKLALQQGYHVFLEKPFACSYQEAVELFSLAQERDLFLLEAITNQYYPQMEMLKQNLSQIGAVSYADFNFSQYSRRYDRYLEGEYFPVFDHRRFGGALTDLNIYNIHAATCLFGKPQKVSYFPHMAARKDTQEYVDVSGVLVLSYPDKVVTCTGAKDSQGPSRLLIQGTKGYIEQKSTVSLMNAPMNLHLRENNQTICLCQETTVFRTVNEFKALEQIITGKDYHTYEIKKQQTLLAQQVLSTAFESMDSLDYFIF